MGLIQVGTKKFTKCEICANVCPIARISVDENGTKAVSDHCPACGHCVAVCPSGSGAGTKRI